ncbi:CPBP family glutamic-type intramembrane protease [Flavobacterium branchiarum]|uniref:Type II CAAX prenyl endopeptidase Rce1 family protein n=1 Tax=Flavobacterium branchiarum TaxID=1114870 RepID=A0ABV5FJP9_9FLAO
MFKNFKKDIRDLFFSPNSIEYLGFSSNFRLVLYYYFIFILFLISLSIFVGWVKYFFNSESYIVLPANILFLKVAVFAPIMEEIIFRLLIRVNKFNLIIFSVFLIVFVLYEKYILSTVVYYVFNGFFLLLLFFKKLNYKLNRQLDKSKYLSLLIYISCFLFGLYHVPNFKDCSLFDIVVIAYLFSKIIAGFIFILLRLKFGIIASILFHMFINSLAYMMVS